MKALLLAAGFGTRLKPLTDFVPKPLTLFMGRPILDIVYGQVTAAGVTSVAVNTHHLSEKIRQHIQKSPVYKHPVHISHESEILGTGGSINPLRPWLAGDDLLIFNGDIVASLDLKAFIAHYQANASLASMVLIPHKEGTTPVYVSGDRVVSIGEAVAGASKRTFAGIHILSKAFIQAVPHEGFLSVIDTYKQLLARGEPILAFEHDSYWADLGIPKDYLEAHESLLRSSERETICQHLHLDTKAWTYDAAGENLFIDCRPKSGFKRSFVFGDLKLDGASELDTCIVYPDSSLPMHSHQERMIITPYAQLNMR